MSDNALFDANESGTTNKRPKAPTPPQAIETVAVMADDRWRMISAKQFGVVHALAGARTTDKKGNRVNIAAMVTYCGIVAVPRTFAHGETVQGCKACIDRGATAVWA